MKIEYDVELYKKIAQLNLNEFVTTENRKGRKTTIYITNITNLSWRELQLLVGGGQDRFSKMVLLYNKYNGVSETESQKFQAQYKGEQLTTAESKEINDCIDIYRRNGFTKHHEINQFITDNKKWDDFPTIRSLNNHGEHKENIEGILPKYYTIICKILGITGENGSPLYKSTHY